MPLEVAESGGIYLCNWDNGIQMKFDRLHEDGKGTVTGEIWVSNISAPANQQFMWAGRTTLTAGDMGVRIGNQLQKRYAGNDVNDFGALVDAARINVLMRFREGEPFVNLVDVPVYEGTRFMCDPLCYMKQANLLYGPGGVGKSITALYVGIMAASGTTNDEMFEVEPGNVLLLDYETSPEEAKGRHMAIAEGLGLMTPPTFHYRRCIVPVAHDQERIMQYIEEFNITFLITDSAAPAVGGDTNDVGLTVAYFQALRRFGITSLTIAHVAKDVSESAGPYGNVFWSNLPRTVWRMNAVDDVERVGSKQIGLHHFKVNNGPLKKSFGIEITFTDATIDEDESVKFEPVDIKTTAMKSTLPASTQILDILLKGGAQSPAEIYEQMGLPNGKAYSKSALGTWLSSNKNISVVSLPGSKWGLTANKKDEIEEQTSWPNLSG